MNEHVGAGIVVKSSPSKGGLNYNEAFHLINTTQSFRLKCLPWEKQPLSS